MPKIIHTSDWHLGGRLHEQSRQEEQQCFLDWLRETLARERPDALIIAGDIFDSSLPGAAAQQQYYDFLGDVAADQSCGSIVIVAGNHDSPALLSAPAALLRRLAVHVIGSGPAFDADKSPLIRRLPSRDGVGLLIGAIPFLRERELRQVQAGESQEHIDAKIRTGLQRYFAEVYELAKAARQGSEPIILTGHLSLGAPQLDADGSERKTYIGNLETAPSSLVPAGVDYLALGHIHKPQSIGQDHFVYSGSPLPMSFAEAGQQKRLVAVCWEAGRRDMRDIPVPEFRRLVRLRGDWAGVSAAIKDLRQAAPPPDGEAIWLEILLESPVRHLDLERQVDELLQDSRILCLKCRERLLSTATPEAAAEGPAPELQELQPESVFDLLLEHRQVAQERREVLRQCFLQAQRHWQDRERLGH